MKWCCDGLKHLFEKRNESGIFIFAEPPNEFSEDVTFWLAMRSTAPEDLIRLKTDNSEVSIRTRIPIKYCPNCGAKLNKAYKKTYLEIVDETILRLFEN